MLLSFYIKSVSWQHFFLTIYYLTFYVILYKYIKITFLSIIKPKRLPFLHFIKFYNICKKLDYKLILISVNFILKK